jgi:hypothetical protein
MRGKPGGVSVIDGAYLSALGALAGSAIGGATSFLSTWLGQGAQFRAQTALNDKGRRQELYRDFVTEASLSYVDALTKDAPDLSKTIRLFALISRMRILSSLDVVEQADSVARMIVDTYPQPNKTLHELHQMVEDNALDPLRGFSEACRKELHDVAY